MGRIPKVSTEMIMDLVKLRAISDLMKQAEALAQQAFKVLKSMDLDLTNGSDSADLWDAIYLARNSSQESAYIADSIITENQ